MNSFQSAITFLSLSMTLHTAAGLFAAGGLESFSSSKSINSIQIESIDLVKPPPMNASIKAETPPKVKRRGIPVPQNKSAIKPVKKQGMSDFQKSQSRENRELKKPAAKSLSAKPVWESHAEDKAKSSSEIIADPKKGKVFIPYFGEVKTKIQKNLFERYADPHSGKGSVTLTFILNPKGFLDKVVVSSRQGNVDQRLEQLAMQCLRDCAPFDRFPPELGTQKIAFNVTIFFEGKE